MILKQTTPSIRVFRLLRLGLLLCAGALVVLAIFPWCGDRRRLALKQSWSLAMLDALAIEVQADLRHYQPGVMVVANHVSWVDILLINAALPVAFVAKEEVRRWPLIGWLAAQNDTVFLRRGSRGHARQINMQVASLLAAGKCVAVFPEGTTTDGRSLLHFHSALLQPALVAGQAVLPVALSYWEMDGQRSLAPRYDGDISVGECARAILRRPRLVARLDSTPLLGRDDGADRKRVAAAAREAIAAAAGLPRASNQPETPAGLPGEPLSGVRPTDSPSPVPADLV